MSKIFISYRRSDSISISGRLYDHLSQAFKPQNVFKDVDNIPPGSDFRKVLKDEVGRCDVLLVVIGRSWVDAQDETGKRRLEDPDDFVRLEVASGLRHDNILVIPVLVDGATMPDVSQLPQELQELPFFNAVTVRNDPDFRRDVQRLIQHIRTALQSQNRLITVLLVSGLIIILLIGYMMWSSSNRPEVPETANVGSSAPTDTLGAKAYFDQTQTAVAESVRLATLEAEIDSFALTSTATRWTTTPTSTHTPPPTRTPSANEWIDQGNRLARQNDFRGAIEAFQQAVSLEPDNDQAYELIGHNAFTIEDYELAAESFSEAFRLNPDNFAGAIGTSDAYIALGDSAKALEALDTALEQFPDNRVLRFQRGQSLVELNRGPEAIEELTFVIDTAPPLGDMLMEGALLTRGYQNVDRNYFQSAVNDFQQVADYNPDNLVAWFEIGYNQERLGNYEEAIDAFAQVLEREPNNYDALTATIIMYRHLSQYSSMAIYITSILDEDFGFTDSQLASFYFLRAEAYLLQEALALAVDDLRRAVEFDEATHEGNALKALGWTLADLGDTTNGIVYLERYIEVANENNYQIDRGAVNKLNELRNR